MRCAIARAAVSHKVRVAERDFSLAPPPRPTVHRAAAQLACGAVVAARDGKRDVAVVRSASGRLFVVDDICPHDGGRLADGYVEGERLICSRHNWEFELATGVCPHAPERTIHAVALPTRR